jgi:hypothetical protein
MSPFTIENVDAKGASIIVDKGVFTSDRPEFKNLNPVDQKLLSDKVLLFATSYGFGLSERAYGDTLYLCGENIFVEPDDERKQLDVDPQSKVLTLPSGARVIPVRKGEPYAG